MEAATVSQGGKRPGRGRARLVPLLFLAPALIFLVVWIIYPTGWTIVRSFFDRDGGDFVAFDNYKDIFTTDTLQTAIKNNVIWVAVVPALVTAIGLIFAVLTERIRWSTAFKTAVFMPMAISLFAAGVIWRVMDEKDPSMGTINATLKVVDDTFGSGGALTTAQPSSPQLTGSTTSGFVLRKPVRAGGTAVLGLTAIPPADMPADARQALQPRPEAGAITGTVWRDFRPGGGRPGVVERGELGLPGVTVELRDPGGGVKASTTSDATGAFSFGDVGSGEFRVAIGSQTFSAPFEGVSWLGEKLITPAVMIAYIWVWAGFAMVIIAAGLSSISREVLEAARTDGATEWQVFRRVTVPMLAPVLSVVFITMIINVLKVFDIILSVAPQSSQDDANVIALAMWRTSFGGINDFGLGSAIAVFLFLLVIPVLALNIRRFKREEN
ncbi:ABC transporter permease [Conexibacter woesei]|uniref:Binding-protein-dependent transport systems inner membrane component n=1 Tax=Conexibacter woesei (strain DSM 14684 / CCUG 47730 / CIP 108061 / JCM 11494 / NBRC 100937 / ID131577) TaxID=469383 RepID=D3FBU1_CONWI|nr:ABC transporter permease subunit [Conexibacter woesei]ADB51356.1 binding-protein-dependent transport systems inner membrane component [Conexibacter woesei DSM 14684]